MASEENRPEAEDVEGHMFTERPPILADQTDDAEPDVEAHAAAAGQITDQVADQLSEKAAD